jgi:hypothetical protein
MEHMQRPLALALGDISTALLLQFAAGMLQQLMWYCATRCCCRNAMQRLGWLLPPGDDASGNPTALPPGIFTAACQAAHPTLHSCLLRCQPLHACAVNTALNTIKQEGMIIQLDCVDNRGEDEDTSWTPQTQRCSGAALATGYTHMPAW